ncbi:MAG TPA: PAS domain S-box protein [Lamprocystis sp. (in: g-proteobacteria)]|nr:PAS domain S-box protein [Lamprocystis sp. (in: g-proteobacteria)]
MSNSNPARPWPASASAAAGEALAGHAPNAAQRAGIRAEEQLARIAATVPGVICSFRLAPDGTASMPYANPAMRDLYGIEPAAVAESFAPIAMHIHPADAPLVQAAIEASARALSPWFAQFRYRHPQKGEIWVEGHSLPLQEADGGVLWHGYVHDITERKRAEQVLQATQADLSRAQALGQIGSWRLDIQEDRLTWSAEAYRVFAVPPDTPLSYETFLAIVHPADRDFVDRHWRAALAGAPYDIEHRILVDGRVKWVREQAELEFDDAGRVRGGFGTAQDITERREAAEQLGTQLRLTKAITDCAAEAIFVTDEEGRVTFLNAEAERTFGYLADELIGRVLHDVIHHHHPDGRPYPCAECPYSRIFDRNEVVRNCEAVYFRKDGSTLTAAISSAPLEIGGEARGAVLVAHDVTEIKRAAASLVEADQRKDEFLAMLAHELRNPLAPIRNAAHILGLLDLGEPRVRWAQRIIEQQVGQLSRIVDDLLDVSRIARGDFVLKPEVIDFAEIAQQVVEGTQPLVESKGHQFRLDLPAQPLWLRCDVVRLSQVLVNLIDNAVKYTPAQGRICLRARPCAEEIEIVLEDNGIGIPADVLPDVFDLFRQGACTPDRATGGLGLGLTLVRRLVQAHGGRVVAESDGRGCGTRMRLWLPRHQAALPTHPAAPAGTADVACRRVLVVEDDAAVAESTALMLRLDGHQVQVARSGPSALQIAAVFRPQAVLLDIGLRGMDGYETARRLRASPQGVGLRLIAVTGYGDARTRERAQAAGFDHHLVKPVEPTILKEVLAGLTIGVDDPPDGPN